jgi:transcriptional regulator with XRE-family HTH domain
MGPATQSSLYKGVDVLATIGSRFKDLRKKAGLTQEAMAKKLQIARSTVGMYEIDTKKVSKEVAAALEKYDPKKSVPNSSPTSHF